MVRSPARDPHSRSPATRTFYLNAITGSSEGSASVSFPRGSYLRRTIRCAVYTRKSSEEGGSCPQAPVKFARDSLWSGVDSKFQFRCVRRS
jgi:hypothetical protein